MAQSNKKSAVPIKEKKKKTEATKKIVVKKTNMQDVIALICTFFDTPFGKTHDWLISHTEAEQNPEWEGRNLEELTFTSYPKYTFTNAAVREEVDGIEIFAYPIPVNIGFAIEIGSVIYISPNHILIEHPKVDGCKLVTKYYKMIF